MFAQNSCTFKRKKEHKKTKTIEKNGNNYKTSKTKKFNKIATQIIHIYNFDTKPTLGCWI